MIFFFFCKFEQVIAFLETNILELEVVTWQRELKEINTYIRVIAPAGGGGPGAPQGSGSGRDIFFMEGMLEKKTLKNIC